MLNMVGPIAQMTPKLRRLLDILEDEAIKGTIRFGCAPGKDETELSSTGNPVSKRRFDQVANFAAPGPFYQRPMSKEGNVSFHFKQDYVTKGADGNSILCWSNGQKSASSTALADHNSYVARGGAAMAIAPSQFAEYAIRGSAVEAVGDGTAAVFSNISSKPEVCRDYWNKVHKHERSRSPDALVFHASRLPAADWKRIAALPAVPDAVREMASRMAGMGESKKKLTKKQKPDGVVTLEKAEAKDLLNIIRSALGGWDWKSPPIRLREGRGGRTQYRITAEFPEGLDAAARVRITLRFAQRFSEHGAKFTAAIHAPDYRNNIRNYHLHFIYSDRPARLMDDGRWDFEVAEKVDRQHERYRYPHRQKKIAWLTRDPKGGNSRIYRAKVVSELRQEFAELCNDELKQAGIKRQFDPRSYAAMGIDQEPTKRLGPAAAALEAAGVPTATGICNAEIIWTAALKAARAKATDAKTYRQDVCQRAHDGLTHVDGSWDSTPADELRRNIAVYEAGAKFLDSHEAEYEEYHVTLAMAEARPKKTIDTCTRILAALANGKGNAAERRDKEKIERRLGQAEEFLKNVQQTHLSCKNELQPIFDKVEPTRAILQKVEAVIGRQLEQVSAIALQRHMPIKSQHVSSGIAVRDETASRDRPSARDQIDAILNTIADSGQPILPPDERSTAYRVPGIARKEWHLLSSETFSPYVQARLAGIAKKQLGQMKEVARIVRHYSPEWLQRHSDHPAYRQVWDNYQKFADHPSLIEMIDSDQLGFDRTMPTASAIHVPTSPPVLNAKTTEAAPAPEPRAPYVRGLLSKIAEAFGSNPTDCEILDHEFETPASTIAPSQANKALAVQDYVDALLRAQSVVLIEDQGTVRVDPSSLPEWRFSVDAFGDEPLVQEAVRTVQECQLREQELNSRTITAVDQAPFCTVQKARGKWVVQGIERELMDRANSIELDPAVTECFEQVAARWAQRSNPATAPQISATHSVRHTPQVAPAIAAPEADVALQSQTEYLARRKQNGIAS